MENYHQIESIILHYLQGSISEDEMRELVVWLNENHKNKPLFFDLKNMYALRKGGLYPSKEEIAQSMRRLTAKMNVEKSDKKPKIYGFYKYAAAAAVLIFLTVGIQMLFHKEEKQMAYIEMIVESGPNMRQITLPDSTKVMLNMFTKLTFPERFDDNLREVFLDGEALFDVTHNEESPFVVRTDKQEITVLGTTFNVMDYSADDYAVTTLVNGSVKMQPVSETEKQGKVYILEQNQQAFLDKTTSEVALTHVTIDPTRAWVNKMYQFRDRPLLEITQRLEKFFDVKIHIADEELKNVEYSGTFQTDQDIDEVMMFLNFGKQFSYTIENDVITIMSNPSKRE